MPAHHQELLGLLDRLCEHRTIAVEHARLQELVLADDDALRLYLEYITLHGTLHWDTAIGDDLDTPVVVGPQRSKPLRQRWLHRHLWTATLVGTALFAVTLAILNPSGGEPVADGPTEVPGEFGPRPIIAEATAEDATTGPPPLVRLDPRQPRVMSVEIAGNSPAADGPQSPQADGPADIASYIDQQLAAGWAESELTSSPIADDAEWVRRASLDLAGRIPDLDTVHAFLGSDNPNKREQFVSELLHGGDFAEHLTTVWANLLVGRRSAAAHERRGLEQFLLTQFRQNRPWNETVGELVAAEGSVEENGAAGFLLAHLNNEAVPATAITARLFLGEQVQCSQCHKHPWNDESQEQFWTLNAFFHQTEIEQQQITDGNTGKTQTVPVLVSREVGGPTYYENLRGVMQVAYPQFGGEAIDPEAAVNRRRELARLLSEEDGHQLARAFVNRMWAHFFGYGFVNPIDDMGPHQPATHPELLDRLAAEFVQCGYDVRQLVRWITSSQAYQLTSRSTPANAADDPSLGDPPLFSRMYVKPMAPEQLFDSVLVATAADRAASRYGSQAAAKRLAWVRQFFEVLENEENGELSTFDGTLPQALTMMNGPLVRAALGGESGTVLNRVLTSRSSDAEKVRELCLAALTREPTDKEQNLFTRHVRQAGSQTAKADAYRDVFWAYLNSNEFVVNH